MNEEKQKHTNLNEVKQRNFRPLVVGLTILIYVILAFISFLPRFEGLDHLDLTVLPMINAILNTFTFIFLFLALVMIKRKDIRLHRRFIYAAFITTFFFLISYVTYHSVAESTPYGGEGLLRPIYYFFLITHIILAAIIVPFALSSVARGLNMEVERHRKIARWTMPMWLYVSFTGVVVYLMISPYY